MKRIIIFLFVSFSLGISYGQSYQSGFQNEKISYNTWIAGASAGIMIPYCDIMDYDFFPKNGDSYKFGWSVFAKKQISPFVGLKGYFTSGKLFAKKSEKHFESDFVQYGINSYFSITDLIFTRVTDKKVNLFFAVGIGLMDFRSVLYQNNVPVSEEGYSDLSSLEKDKATSEFIVPVAFGINIKLSKLIDVNVETSLNNLISSDKLDCTRELRNDKYGYTNVGLSFKIGNKKNYHLAWLSTQEKKQFEEKLAKQNLSEIELLRQDRDFLAEKVSRLDSLLNSYLQTQPDDDNDGVPNSRDLEPNTPPNYIANFQGIGISITDTVVEVDTLITKDKELLFSIYFDFNSYEVKEEDNMKLAEVVKKLKMNPLIKIEIRGHADKTGSAEYNRQLSKKRTQAVVDKLVNDYNVDPDRLIQTYKGEDDPLSKGDDYINRRVDFIILKMQD